MKTSMMKSALLAAAAALSLAARSAAGGTMTWKAGVDGTFGEPANWEGGVPPSDGDTLRVGVTAATSEIRFAPSEMPIDLRHAFVFMPSPSNAEGPADFEWDARGTVQNWYGFSGNNRLMFLRYNDDDRFCWYDFSSAVAAFFGTDNQLLMSVTNGRFAVSGQIDQDCRLSFLGGVWDMTPGRLWPRFSADNIPDGARYPLALADTKILSWAFGMPTKNNADYTVTMTNSTIDVVDCVTICSGGNSGDSFHLVMSNSCIAATNCLGIAAQPRLELLTNTGTAGGRTVTADLFDSRLCASSFLFGGWNDPKEHEGQNAVTATLNGDSAIETAQFKMSVARAHSRIVLNDRSSITASNCSFGGSTGGEGDGKASSTIIANDDSSLSLGGTIGHGGQDVLLQLNGNAALRMAYFHIGNSAAYPDRPRLELHDNARIYATAGGDSWIGAGTGADILQTGGSFEAASNNNMGMRAASVWTMTGGAVSFGAFRMQDSSRLELKGGVFEVDQFVGYNNTVQGALFADGGTLRPKRSINFLYYIGDARLGERGLTLDTAEYAAQINQAFGDADDGSGGSVTGLLTKVGSGSLYVRANSSHAVTAVAQGTLTIPQTVETFGRTLVVTNGATATTRNNQAQTLRLDGLVLGDGTTRGTLELDDNDVIELTDASHISFNGGYISVPRDLSVDGTFTLFTVKSGEVTAAQFAGLRFVNAAHGKTYTVVPETNGETGETAVKIEIADFQALDSVWTGAEGNTFTTPGSWEDDNMPTSDSRAIFGSSAAEQTINVPGQASVNSLDFSAADVTLAGEGPLAVSMEIAVAEGSSADLAVPLASAPIDYIQKTGTGSLTLSGDNTSLLGGFEIVDGFVDINDATSLGTGRELVLGGGTLRYVGDEDATISKDVRLAAPANLPACVEVSADRTLTISGTFESASGLFAKFGAGELVYEAGAGTQTLSASNGHNAGGNGNYPTGVPVRSADGSQTSMTGFQGFGVYDGTMHLKGIGANATFFRAPTVASVASGYASTAPVELVVDNCSLYLGGSGCWFILGANYQPHMEDAYPESVFSPTITIVNGGVLSGNAIGVNGENSSVMRPLIHVVDGRVAPEWESYFGALYTRGYHSWGTAHVIVERNGEWIHRGSAPVGLGSGFDIEVKGGLFGDENANAISTWNATSGRIAVSDGGTLRLHALSLSNDLVYNNKECSVEFAFDDGVLDLCRSGSLTTTLPDRNMISVASGGMEIVATNGIVQTVSIPVKGGGTIVKTGSGSLAFVEADSEKPTALAEFTGLLNVREGTVTLADGTEGTSYRLMVASGAALVVEGSGAIRLAPSETSAGAVDLNGNAVTVDFGFAKKDGSEGTAERGRVYPVAVLAADDAFVASDWSVANAGGSFAPEFSFDTASRLVSVKMNARGFMVIVR